MGISAPAPSDLSFPISHFPPPALTERHLAALWQNQSFPPQALVTTRGQPLRVIYRGRQVGGPGPDFRDVMISAPWGLLQGDVELHVRSSDFRRHGHEADAAYNGIVLHVVFQHDEREDTLLEDGRRVAVAEFASWVRGRAREIRSWLERPGAWREPCFSTVARLGAAEAGETLDRLGDMRFRRKMADYTRRLQDEAADQVLWEGLLEGLGYGGETETFRRLARDVRWDTLRSRLLKAKPSERAALAQRQLSGVLSDARGDVAVTKPRPGNRLEQRLAGAAQLAARFAPSGLVACLTAPLTEDAREGRRVLLKHLTVPAAIGSARAVELLANAVLPCLAALGPEQQARRAEAVYRALPLPERYGAVRHLHGALAADITINARRQQGMLYLLRQYCTQGGCGRCPLS